MKYLRFWLKRALKVTTKDLLRALIVRRTCGSRGRTSTDVMRAHIERGCAGSVHSCVLALPTGPPAPCLCAPLCPAQSTNFTQSWLHSNAFVSWLKYSPTQPHQRPSLVPSPLPSISGIVLLSFLWSFKRWQGDFFLDHMNILDKQKCLQAILPCPPSKSAYLELNGCWLMDPPFNGTYAILGFYKSFMLNFYAWCHKVKASFLTHYMWKGGDA